MNNKTSNAAETAETTTRTLLFYERPTPLNRERHRDLRLRTSSAGFAFARTTNSIPVAGEEFTAACRTYPIVFAGKSAEHCVPAVLLGLRNDENLFVDAAGHWDESYIPAFVRRYPFVLAEQPDGDDFTVCVDESYSGLDRCEGEPLFEKDGSEGSFLQRAVDFLSHYQGQMKRTQTFVERLNSLDLLQDKAVQGTTQSGENYALRGLYTIDEDSLQRLTDAQLRQFLAAGELGWIYAHLISLGNVQSLARRLEPIKPQTSHRQEAASTQPHNESTRTH